VPAAATVSVTAVAPGHGRATAGPTTLRPNESVAHFEIRMGRTGAVRGVVRGPNGAIVAGALVSVAPSDDPSWARDFTGPDGSYRLAEIPLGAAVVITAGARLFTDSEPARGVLVTDERPEATQDLTLRPPTSLVVRVLGPNGDAVHPSASIGWRGPWIQSGPDGTITFDDVDPRTGWFRARADGCAAKYRNVTLRESERNEVEIRLEAAVGIAGVVRDEAGRLVEGVALSGGGCLDWTDREGRFRLEPLPPGPCRVTMFRAELVSAPGFDPKSPDTCTISVPADGVVLVVASRPMVRFRVVPPAGMPCRAPEFVTQCALATAPNVGDAASEAPAQFTFIDTGSTVVRISSSKVSALRLVVRGCAPVVLPIPPHSAGFADLGDVHLSVGRTLTGRVVDGYGRPVASASVSATETTSADSSGAFTLGGLADGPAVLRATQGDAGGAAYVEAVERAAPVTIVLRPMGTLHVAVVDMTGVGNGETVEVRDGAVAGTADPGRLTTSTADGAGKLDVRVVPGVCRVRAGGKWTEVTVPEGGEATAPLPARVPRRRRGSTAPMSRASRSSPRTVGPRARTWRSRVEARTPRPRAGDQHRHRAGSGKPVSAPYRAPDPGRTPRARLGSAPSPQR
jgi:hypothetical protein